MRLSLLIGWLLAVPLAAAAQTVLYQEDFEHGPKPLAGKTPNVSLSGATWESRFKGTRSSFFGDGKVVGTAQSSIWLPFTPKAGHRYTLEATLAMNNGPHDRGVSLGFASDDANKPFDKLPSYGTIVMFRNPNNALEAYAGPGRDNPVPTPKSKLLPTHVRIVLDASAASSADWTLSFFIENTPFAEKVKVPAASGSLDVIQFAGFTVVGGGGSGKVLSFLLTEQQAAAQ